MQSLNSRAWACAVEEDQCAPRTPEQFHDGAKKSSFDGKIKSNLFFLHLILKDPQVITVVSHSLCLALLSLALCPTAASLRTSEWKDVEWKGLGWAVFLHPPPGCCTPVPDRCG